MSNRNRVNRFVLSLAWGFPIALFLALCAGCSSGSKYVERTGWHPFALREAPVQEDEGKEETVRAQSAYYPPTESAGTTLSYSGTSSGSSYGTDPTYESVTIAPFQVVDPTSSQSSVSPSPTAEEETQPASSSNAYTGSYSGYDSSPNATVALAPTGSRGKSFSTPGEGYSVNTTVPINSNQAVEFSAVQPLIQTPELSAVTSFPSPAPAQNIPSNLDTEMVASHVPYHRAEESIPLPTLPELPDLSFLNDSTNTTPQPPVTSQEPLSAGVNLSEEDESTPPDQLAFPQFAKNAYDSLEKDPVEQDAVARDPHTGKAIPERTRESLIDREKVEDELRSRYKKWNSEFKASQKKSSNLPRYLQPISDDRNIFDDPEGPFARRLQEESEKEHKFIRQVTAADLTMMTQVSSPDELMDWEKEQDMPIDWSKYSWKKLGSNVAHFFGMGADEKAALGLMAQACAKHEEYEQTKDVKKLKEAAALYEKAASRWKESLLEEDGLFYAAECRFFAHQYTASLTLYKALLEKYSNSVYRRDVTERLYWLGCYWLQCSEEDPHLVNVKLDKERPRFSDFEGAKKALETIFTNDISDRGRAPDALFTLANGYMRRGVQQGDPSFDEAARYYQQLVEFYPACDHVDKAYQLAMLALYMSYDGPLYDPTPLKKAAEIAVAAQNAGKGDPDVIADQLELIRKEQARNLMARGKYYERQQYYASARSYYNQIVNEYPESEFAQEAAQRYSSIENNPAEADQFSWVRPVVPFLPKSENKYYEDRPSDTLHSMATPKEKRSDDISRPDFTALNQEEPKKKDSHKEAF